MRLLFLDIDGVLNSAEYVASDRCRERGGIIGIDRAAVPRLNAITDRTGAGIVVSSSWRIGKTVDRMGEILAAHGVTGEVVSCTPVLTRRYSDHPEDDTRVVVAQERGHEIQAWLDEMTGPPAWLDVEAFAILDDSSDMAHLRDRLVRTTWERGLLDEHVERVVAMLGEVRHAG